MNAFLEDYFDGVDKIDITNKEQLKMLRSCTTEMETKLDEGDEIEDMDMQWLLDKLEDVLSELIERS